MTLAAQTSLHNPFGSRGRHNQKQTKDPRGGNKKKVCHFVFGSVQLYLTTPKSYKLSLTSKMKSTAPGWSDYDNKKASQGFRAGGGSQYLGVKPEEKQKRC